MVGCGIVAALGAAALARSLSMPVFSVNEGLAEEAFINWCGADARINHVVGKRYMSLFTSHYWWLDMGTGLLLTTGTLALLIYLSKLRSNEECEPRPRTPRRRWHFIALGIGVIAWSWWTAMYSLELDLSRRILPWCADSVAIPMFQLTALTLIAAPILVAVGLAVSLAFGRLPVSLTLWDRSHSAKSWVVSGVCGALAVVVGAALVLNIQTSLTWTAPSLVIALYLLASTRAALLSPKHRDGLADCR